MKFVLLTLLLALLVGAARADGPGPISSDPVLWGAQGVPNIFDAANNRVLLKEMARPEHFPPYLFKPPGKSRTKVGRFFVDGKIPNGPMRCEHIDLREKQSDETLKWEDRNTAATNVYYHVHRAIDYFNRLSTLVGEPIYRETRPVTVRVDMNVDWAMWIKFAKTARFNTSQTFPDADPDKWGTPEEEREIWFFVPKRKYLPFYVVGRYIPFVRDTVLGTAGFPLDSARVPSIIYHEWTHLMTRPYLGILKDSVLNEGYSDYFGSVISQRPAMGDTEEFSSMPYSRNFAKEPGVAAAKDYVEPGNFVPRFFWSLRRRFGSDRTDALLWRTLKFLSPKSELRDLPQAILRALEAAPQAFNATEAILLKHQIQRSFKPVKGRKGS